MKTETVFCDICDDTIDHYDPEGSVMITSEGWNQVWPREGLPTLDVCHICCEKLYRARQLGLITYDDAPLFLAAGFVKHESGAWVKKYPKT